MKRMQRSKPLMGSKVTLAHGHFKVVGMAAMTMAYPVARIEILKGLKVGDKVRAGVRQSDDGLVIEQLTKQGVQP
ncbi:copper-binding protein [Chitinibacter sp. FCG-7]|uniref:Copper-binding protein n=1 Tax=Chitinibacter mangrovi TaxID=3153927 RepID=A0AAU7FBB8_9NEIS